MDMRTVGDFEKSSLGRRVYSSARLGRNTRQGWQGLVNDLYGSLDIDIHDDAGFRGEILRSSAGRMELTEIFTTAEVAHRRKQHIAKDSADFYLFGLSIAGSASYEQYGRESVVKPQHFGLLYTAAPYQFRHVEDIHRICLKIPAAALQARVGDAHARCSVARPVLPGLPRLVADLLVSIARQADRLSDSTIPVVEANTLDLIGLLLSTGADQPAVSGTSVRWALHKRASAFLTESLHQPDLDPDRVAAGIGISTRYLHRVFEDADDTVAETLLRLRLERCRAMLADPASRPLSVKEIAFKNGFKSQSHCASAFKARFGITPREVRQAVMC